VGPRWRGVACGVLQAIQRELKDERRRHSHGHHSIRGQIVHIRDEDAPGISAAAQAAKSKETA
jgi:hypothetical protein